MLDWISILCPWKMSLAKIQLHLNELYNIGKKNIVISNEVCIIMPDSILFSLPREILLIAKKKLHVNGMYNIEKKKLSLEKSFAL